MEHFNRKEQKAVKAFAGVVAGLALLLATSLVAVFVIGAIALGRWAFGL